MYCDSEFACILIGFFPAICLGLVLTKLIFKIKLFKHLMGIQYTKVTKTTTRDDYDNGEVVGSICMNNFEDKTPDSNLIAFTDHIDYMDVDVKGFLCHYCLEDCPMSKVFRVNGCRHLFCSDCVAENVANMLERNIINVDKCLMSECEVELEPQHCRSILPHHVFDRWNSALYCLDDAEVRDSDLRIENSNSNLVASNREINSESDDDVHGPVGDSRIKYSYSNCASLHREIDDESEARENINKVKCPDTQCDGKLEIDLCKSILPSDRFYCPFKDCSALLIKDTDMARLSRCPNCHRLLCTECKVPWHSFKTCEKHMSEDEARESVIHSKSKVLSSDFRVEYLNSNSVASQKEIDDDADVCAIDSNPNAVAHCANESTAFTCDICVEEKPPTAVFRVLGCNHSYCSDCVATYVSTKLQENISNIQCPETLCNGKLEIDLCKSILPPKAFDKWSDTLCEALILPSERFYCPFKDCSALLIKDTDVVRLSRCPNCRRMLCAECKVPWHSKKTCEKYTKGESGKKMKDNDKRLIKLADKNNWKRCPKCKVFVEKIAGCKNMTCRCGCKFCYRCGAVRHSGYCSETPWLNKVLWALCRH